MSAKETSVFKDPDVTENLSTNSRQTCFVLQFLHTRPLTTLFLSENKYYTDCVKI